ncbi:FAD-dependent pyridine nucleotide-disulfide oxidoreductase [Nocardioides sp. JS614]|nr:FAD-dependent pyridine nucleotide-disulfide oxidoreductase [Nocardioides sp. JS614]
MMVETEDPVVVLGGGMAGGRAAEFLAMRGRGTRVVLVSDEDHRPYQRPPLSKESTWDDPVREELFFRDEEFYASKGVQLALGTRVEGLLPDSDVLITNQGEKIAFSRLLIATGCRVRRLQVPGSDLRGVHYLRSIPDAKGLWDAVHGGGPVVVVGAGYVGCELAAVMAGLQVDVTVVEAGSEPLGISLGAEVGAWVRSFHERRGVKFVTGRTVVHMDGEDRVGSVRLDDGTRLPASTVVVGIGVVPDVEWLSGSGVEIGDGILVNERCETSRPGVFAAGDAVRWTHPQYGSIRLEHETNAQAQAVVAARNILGGSTEYNHLPYVWSDQYGDTLEYVGYTRGWNEAVVQTDETSFTAAYLTGGAVAAVAAYARPDVIALAKQVLSDGPVARELWRAAAKDLGV